MKHKRLYRIAKKIDKLRKDNNPNRNKILKLLQDFNPKFIGAGRYKRSFKVESNVKNLVFKVGRNLNEDFNHFLECKGKRKLKYAKIYWVTKNCLLQRFCSKGYDNKEYQELRKEFKKAGYIDINKNNVGRINGKLHAFDITYSKRKKPISEKRN